jgi:hypothetical protein
MNPIGIIVIIIFLIFSLPVSGTAADPDPSITAVDHGIYAELLSKYVKKGVVNYQGFKSEEARLDQYLKILEKVNSAKLSRKEQFAFYANAYNAWTIKLILSGYPGVQSIKDLGSFLQSPWKKKIARLDGDIVTLDHIEHDILRPRFKDPRVHFAINCAAFSCPPLNSEPYWGSRLDRQLNESTRGFINDPKQNYIEGTTLYVSKIFKWFRSDFDDEIIGFFIKYATGDFKKELENMENVLKVKYLHYDWSLNGS